MGDDPTYEQRAEYLQLIAAAENNGWGMTEDPNGCAIGKPGDTYRRPGCGLWVKRGGWDAVGWIKVDLPRSLWAEEEARVRTRWLAMFEKLKIDLQLLNKGAP